MSGAIDAVSDIGLGDILDNAKDVGSLVTDFGTEYLDTSSFTSFEIPGVDVSSLGGFDVAGSFAGDASWFDTFNSGSILDSIPSVSDFSLPSLPDSLPSLSSLKDVVSTVSNDLGGFVKNAQAAFAAYQKVAPVVNLAASALGIQNPVNAIIAPVSQAVGIAGAAAGVAGSASTGDVRSLATNPAVVSAVYSASGTGSIPVAQTISAGVSAYNIASAAGSTINSVSQPGTVVATNGFVGGTFRELTAAEDAALTRNITPGLINSLTDPGTAHRSRSDDRHSGENSPLPVPRQPDGWNLWAELPRSDALRSEGAGLLQPSRSGKMMGWFTNNFVFW